MSSYSFQGRSRVWTPRDEEENRAIFSARRQETGIQMPQEFKPVYLANAEYEVAKWTVPELMRLLRLYGAHRCLWDVADPDNRNRKLRKAALVDITAAIGSGVTRAQVVQKINVLRATYRYEKRRIKQRIRKGIGAKTKLKWFALADAFLRSVPRLDKFRKTESADTDSDLEDTLVFTIDPETLMPLDEEEEAANNVFERQEKSKNSTTVADIKEETMEPTQEAGEIDLYDAQTFDAIDYEEKVTAVKTEQNVNLSKLAKETIFKTKWTSKESLNFVRLLKEQPALWHYPLANSCEVQQEHAVAMIAKEMQLPQQRITKRVHTFRRTYESEKLKILHNANYVPNFVWWKEAESFMSTTIDKQLHVDHFVDANDTPPATPQTMQQRNIKQEEDDNNSSPQTPLNPIPSVAPPSVLSAAVEEALEALFNVDTNEMSKNPTFSNENESGIKTELLNDDSRNLSSLPQSPATQIADDALSSTKLIWNGLEDDLLEGKWSLKHSVKFLRLYGAHRCLWDLSDPDYRSRELRQAAIEDIAAAMGYGLDADYVAKKIKIFRITYMQHRKRMLATIKQGKEPELQLRWFPLADSFLRPHIGLRSIKEGESELPQFDYQYVVANLNLIDPALLTDFRGKGTQNTIEIGAEAAAQELQDIEQCSVQKISILNSDT